MLFQIRGTIIYVDFLFFCSRFNTLSLSLGPLLGSLGRALARALAIFASHTERWRWPIPTGTGTAKVSKMGAFRHQVVLRKIVRRSMVSRRGPQRCGGAGDVGGRST